MKNLFLTFVLAISILPVSGFAASHYAGGRITNITTYPGGTLIMIDAALPDNCAGTPYGWMLVREEHKTMNSLVLTMWATGKTKATIYTKPKTDTSYCELTQIDPGEGQ